MVEWYKKFTDRSDKEVKMFAKHFYSGRGILEALRDELYKRNGKMLPFDLLPEKLKSVKKWAEVYSIIRNFELFEVNDEGFWDMEIWNYKQCKEERKRISDTSSHPTFGVTHTQPQLTHTQPESYRGSIGQQLDSSSLDKIRLDNNTNTAKTDLDDVEKVDEPLDVSVLATLSPVLGNEVDLGIPSITVLALNTDIPAPAASPVASGPELPPKTNPPDFPPYHIPSLLEVKQFFAKYNYPEQLAVEFYNHYQTRQWKDQSSRSIRSWPGLARTQWFKTALEKPINPFEELKNYTTSASSEKMTTYDELYENLKNYKS